MKYIIALYHSADKGKTQTLWHLAKLLISEKNSNVKINTMTDNPK
jgi:hypothetical protein